jgi:polygalacturonase
MFKRVLGLFLLASIGLVASKSISDFGAVAGLDTFEQAQQNALSILKAFDAANAEGETDRTVHVPKLAGNAAFYVTPFNAEGMTDVTFQVDGECRHVFRQSHSPTHHMSVPIHIPITLTLTLTLTLTDAGILRVNNDLEQWDKEDKPAGIVMFTEANGLHLTGSGTIDGQGTVWWEYVMQGKGDFRSNLVDFESSQHVEVSHIYLLNSPRFNLNLHDVAHASIHDITIFTDSNVTRPHGRHGAVYPLNTDGTHPRTYL